MNPKLKRLLLLIGLPVCYALGMWLLFDLNPFRHFYQVMSIGFLFGVPFGIGYLTIFLSSVEAVKQRLYRELVPWIPIFIFFFVTLALAWEGLACWLMILPIFLIFSSIGGIVAAKHKIKRHRKRNKLQVSLVFFLPILIVPLERAIPDSATRYTADTGIEIYAPAATIWNNVIRVRSIQEKEDHGRLTRVLGFPRPIRAELDYAGIGGRRQAIFSKGLVFEETVKEYADTQRMSFSIKADPSSVPPTTMDKHIVVGGEFFDVLDGTYELEALPNGAYRLHLYSHFTLKTRFNFYAHWWARWIMLDIQDNILQVIKNRCEDR